MPYRTKTASATPPRPVKTRSRNEQYIEVNINRIRGTAKSKALCPNPSTVAIKLKPFTGGILCPYRACVNFYLILYSYTNIVITVLKPFLLILGY
jgi:hypothetical protein